MRSAVSRAEKISFAALFLAAAVLYGVGLDWGLPSIERRDTVLEPQRQTMAMYERTALERSFQATQGGPAVLVVDPANPAFERQLYHSLSSYLIRSMDGDEQRIYAGLARLKPRAGQWDPGYYTYGGPYYAAIGAALLTGRWLGSVELNPEIVVYYQSPQMIANLYSWGRLASALSGMACLVLLFLVARRLMDWRAASAATALFSFSPIAMYLTHTVKPHLLGSAFGLAGIYFCVSIYEFGRRRDYWLAAVFFGLATGTTMNLWPLTLLIGFVHIAQPELSWQALRRKLLDRRVWMAGVLAVVVFFLVNPFVLLNSQGWLADLRAQAAERSFGLTFAGIAGLFKNSLAHGAGAALWVSALGGFLLCHQVSANRPLFLFAGLFTVLSILQFGSTSTDSSHPARYLLPLFIIGAIAAGALLELIASKSKTVAAAVGILLVGWSGQQALMAALNYRDDNPRTAVSLQAGKWINENIPAGETIGTSTNLMVDRQPPFQFFRYRISIHEPGKPIDPKNAPAYFIASANPTLGANENRPYLYHDNFLELYEPVEEFRRVRRGGYTEYFSSANYPVWIFQRKPSL